MDSSLKVMLNTSVQYCKFIKETGSGNKQYAIPVVINCYAYGNAQLRINVKGQEVQTSYTLLFDGIEPMLTASVKDTIIYNSITYPIMTLGSYKNEQGQVDIIEVNI